MVTVCIPVLIVQITLVLVEITLVLELPDCGVI